MPAFTSSSLKLPISVRSFSSGITPASVSLVTLISTMTRIAVSPSVFLVRSLGRRPFATMSSRPFALAELRLQVGKLGNGLLDVGREVRHFLHLANLDHLVVPCGA